MAIAQETNGFVFSEVRVVTMAAIGWMFLKVIVALSGWGRAG